MELHYNSFMNSLKLSPTLPYFPSINICTVITPSGSIRLCVGSSVQVTCTTANIVQWIITGLKGVHDGITGVSSLTLSLNSRINTTDSTILSPSNIFIHNFTYADNGSTVACEDGALSRTAPTTLLAGKPTSCLVDGCDLAIM